MPRKILYQINSQWLKYGPKKHLEKPQAIHCGAKGDCYPKRKMDRWLKERGKRLAQKLLMALRYEYRGIDYFCKRDILEVASELEGEK